MAFDISTARPVFDISTAKPVEEEQPQAEQQQKVKQGSLFDQVIAPVKSVAGGLAGTVAGGYTGLAGLIAGDDLETNVKNMQSVRDSLAKRISQHPDSEQAQRGMQILENSMKDIESVINFASGGSAGLAKLALNPSDGLEGAQQTVDTVREKGLAPALGQDVLDKTGSPLLATGAELLPTIGEMALGKRTFNKSKPVSEVSNVEMPQDLIVKTGQANNVPVLTTDVFPPTSYIGKLTQRMSEKLGPLGSGTARQSQQIARQNMVTGLADEFDLALDSPLYDQIVKSISAKNARTLELGNIRRQKAITALEDSGSVPTSAVKRAAQNQLEKQAKLKSAASDEAISDINDYLDATDSQNFRDLASVRSELIRKIKDTEGGTSESKTTRLGALKEIKSAIDQDMKSFAEKTDRDAAANWVRSNRMLAEQLTNVKTSELKRIIEKGDVTPEVVMPILRGGKRSELQRLYGALTPAGKDSARAAVIKDALDRSGYFRGDANPNKFATELGKTNTKQAIDIMFTDVQKAQLSGMERLLNATRRAQDAPLNLETGQQVIPFITAGAVGGGMTTSPFITLATTGSMSAVAKAYESKVFRNLLLKLNRTKKGSRQETEILASLTPLVIAGFQASKKEQEEIKPEQ